MPTIAANQTEAQAIQRGKEEEAYKTRQAMNDAIWKTRQAYEAAKLDLEQIERDLSSAADGIWLSEYHGYLERRVAELRDGERDAYRDLSEVIHDTCDDSSYVIYNAQALRLLSLSENRDAYDNVSGESGATENVRAFYAMEADLLDAIKDAGGNLDAEKVGQVFASDDDSEE